MKIDKVVVRETAFIAMVVFVFSGIMELVWILLGQWTPAVLWGNLLGIFIAVLDFFLMALGVQIASTRSQQSIEAEKAANGGTLPEVEAGEDEEEAPLTEAALQRQNEIRKIVKTSQSLRRLLMLVLLAVGMLVPVFDRVAVLLPLLFPKVGAALRAKTAS